jgi:hypothetical protein
LLEQLHLSLLRFCAAGPCMATPFLPMRRSWTLHGNPKCTPFYCIASRIRLPAACALILHAQMVIESLECHGLYCSDSGDMAA